MPYVTGTSVLAFVYKDGVMVACDTLASYGSTKRYKSVQRVTKVNDTCMVGAAGEISDFQYILRLLDELATDDYCHDDGVSMEPSEVYSYLSRVLYNRRNKFDPLWNSLVVAGFRGGKPFLGMVGMVGTCYQDTTVATGFGQHLARPLFREVDTTTLSKAEAEELMHKALKVCYYRDKQSINKFQLATVTDAGVEIGEPFSLQTDWEFKRFVNPAASAVGTW